MEHDELIWAATAAAITLGVTTLVQKALAREWRTRRGVSPAAHDTSLTEAVMYAVASGAAVGLTRLVADRTLRFAKARRLRATT